MDYKKTNAPLTTTVHDIIEMAEPTGNIYETVCIISKRANQIAAQMKEDLEDKLNEFATLNDNLEEISENREQIEISKYYEKLPKPTLIATQFALSQVLLHLSGPVDCRGTEVEGSFQFSNKDSLGG